MPVSSLPSRPVAELLTALSSGNLTSRQLVESCLEAISAQDDTIHAMVHVDAEGALKRADRIDERRRAGEPLGLLAGLPVAIKDNICCRHLPCTCGSRMLESFRPPYDAHVTEAIQAADGIIIGTTNMDEFAMGSSTETSAWGPTRHPDDPQRIPGGSSGGSAAAVSAGLVPLALGSDTGGSIRQPAAFCGCVGLKPTYGRVSRYGLVAFASSLDQIGPFARDAVGAALLLQAVAGHDVRDSTSVRHQVPDYRTELSRPLSDLRIGLIEDHFAEGLGEEMADAVRRTVHQLEERGASVRTVRLPHSKYCVATYYLVASSEASSNLARYDGIHYGRRADGCTDLMDVYCRSRGEGFGPEVKRRIMLGTYALSAGYYDAYYLTALKVRRRIREDFDAAFRNVDVLAGPVTPTPAFRIGEKTDDPLAMYLSDIYTISANLAGIPAISVPAGRSENGLPLAVQFQAPPFEESRLLRLADAVLS